jgi:hypothetical protein
MSSSTLLCPVFLYNVFGKGAAGGGGASKKFNSEAIIIIVAGLYLSSFSQTITAIIRLGSLIFNTFCGYCANYLLFTSIINIP